MLRENPHDRFILKDRVNLGEHEQKLIPANLVVMMPQVRADKNPEFNNIKDSIDTEGLLYPIDVAVMDETPLVDYISFTNNLWGMKNDIDDYRHLQDPCTGTFNLVCAGHTRTLAIQKSQEEHPERTYFINSNIHPISDPGEIVSLQLRENFHSKTPPERNAILIVETYQYGVLNGDWSTPGEFLDKKQGKYSKNMIYDAIGFARLPIAARDFVFSGGLSYAAAVQLGRSGETFADNILANLDPNLSVKTTSRDAIPDDLKDMFNEAYDLKLNQIIAHIKASNLQARNAVKYIIGQTRLAEEQAAKLRGELDMQDSMFDMSMMSNEEQQGIYLESLRKDLESTLQKITSLEHVDALLELQHQLGRLGIDPARRSLERSKIRVREKLGDFSPQSTNQVG